MKHKRIYKLHIFECVQCSGSYLGEFFSNSSPNNPRDPTLARILHPGEHPESSDQYFYCFFVLSIQNYMYKMMLLVLSFIKY